jgi:high mobility group AT-hook protein 2
VQDCITFIRLIFSYFFLVSSFPILYTSPPLDRIMARTKEDVASKGDASPQIPKSSAGVTKSTAEAPVKRGRGRPPKGSAPMPKKVYVPTGRPRGRPPASGAKKAAAAAKKAKAVAAATAQNDDGTPKKGRGRPRKAAVAAATSDEEPAATTPKEPKKRGRKPKVVEPDASGDEADDAEPGKNSQISND